MRTTGRRMRLAAPAAAACLLLTLSLWRPAEVRAQWTAPDSAGRTNYPNGNVGIGTATPEYPLTVSKSINGPTAIATFNTADGTNAQVSAVVSRTMDFSSKYLSWGVTAPSFSMAGYGETAYFHSAGVPLKFGSNTAHDILFFTNGITNTRMTITGGGNVGIGTVSPGSPLEVVYNNDNFLFGVNVKNTNTGTQALVGYGLDNAGGSRVGQFAYVSPSYTTASLRDTVLFSSVGATTKLGFVSSAEGSGNPDLYFRAGGSRPDSIYIQGSTGNVGVGTPTPAAKLDVNTGSNTAVAINATGALNVTGTITGGSIQATYQDVAEWVPSTQKLAAGTVVVLDAGRVNHVMASASAYDTKVAGVVSAEPGVILGTGGEGKVKVATTGRVRVKVDASRGAIKVGDLLVTSGVEGLAMKSVPVDLGGTQIHRPGTIIGKALEPLEGGVGEILVLLSLQ